MAPELLRRAGPIRRLLADKAYDTNKLRHLLAEHGVDAVIPSIARRKPLIPYDRVLYPDNAISSNACSAASRTSDVLQPATISSPETSSPASLSLLR
jgi:hypothetical protein